MKVLSFTEYYYRQIRLIFIILMGLALLVDVLDIFQLHRGNNSMILKNSITAIIIIGVFLLHFIFKVRLEICFGIGLYTLIANLFLSQLVADRSSNETLLILFRESIFLILMLIFSGIFIHKLHSFIILSFILFRYTTVAILMKPPFLLDNLFVLILIYIAIAWVVYIFSGKLHNSIAEIQHKQAFILSQNNELRTAMEELRSTTEDLAKKNKKMQEVNLAKDKFFTIISHDLRNPLNSLKGFVDLLINRGEKIDKVKKKKYLSQIKESVGNLYRLLEDLLEWSLSQSNKIKCEPNQLSILDLAASVSYFLKQLADNKSITIVNQTRSEHLIYADYNMIFTVLRNLVANAIKFSFHGSDIKIQSEVIGDLIKVKVIDKGTGIDPEIISGLFDIDNTYSSPGTDNESGTGLGLILCKEFIGKNNGFIGVDSLPEGGSVFWFTLPKEKTTL